MFPLRTGGGWIRMLILPFILGPPTLCHQVYDNFVGIASTNGDTGNPDPYCVQSFGQADCVGFAKSQQAPPTFIDRLDTAGYNITLFGKMHAGEAL